MSYGGYEYGAPTDAYGGGGGGGGGFMPGNGDFQGGAMGFGSPDAGAGGGGKVSKEQKTLLPLTVHQLLSAGQDEPDAPTFKVDGCDLHQVKIVGQVLEIVETATMRAYKVDDGTGVLSCRVFVEQDETEYAQERRSYCQKGSYVRVVGQMREYQGQRHLSVHNMRVVKDGNEITHHLLEVIWVHCQNTKGRMQKPGAVGGMGVGMGNMAGGMMGGYGQKMMGGGGGGGGGGGAMSNVNQAVLDAFMEHNDGDVGADLATVIRALSTRNITPNQVQQAVEFLAQEGQLYTTTDENHYKAT